MEKIKILKYKGILFDNWEEETEDGVTRYWAEMCNKHAEQHKDILKTELDYAGAGGCCSVYGCGDVPAADNEEDEIGNSYIDFDVDLIEFIEVDVSDNISIEESLTNFIKQVNIRNGNTDVNISNIRLWKNGDLQNAYADVSFTWYLNSWAKPTVLTDVPFLFRNGEWLTQTIF